MRRNSICSIFPLSLLTQNVSTALERWLEASLYRRIWLRHKLPGNSRLNRHIAKTTWMNHPSFLCCSFSQVNRDNDTLVKEVYAQQYGSITLKIMKFLCRGNRIRNMKTLLGDSYSQWRNTSATSTGWHVKVDVGNVKLSPSDIDLSLLQRCIKHKEISTFQELLTYKTTPICEIPDVYQHHCWVSRIQSNLTQRSKIGRSFLVSNGSHFEEAIS